MINKITYTNSRGESITFGEGVWGFGDTDLFDSESDYDTIGGKILSFKSKIKTYSLEAYLSGPESERRRLADITSYDRIVGKPGRLTAGECYMECYVNGVASHDWYQLEEMYAATLSIVTDAPVWVRRKSITLDSASEPEADGLDYPHDFPFDYLHSTGASMTLNNPFMLPAKCDITFVGPCVTPYVIIAGNRYQVDCTIERGQLLTIKGFGKRDVILRNRNGTEVSLFDKRVSEPGARPFEEIPVGKSQASWGGSQSIEVALYEERPTPW